MRKNMEEKTILIEAVPFGYGPASIAIAIAEELREETKHRSIRLIALGKDVSYELFSSSDLFDEVWKFDNYDSQNWDMKIKNRILKSDAIISSVAVRDNRTLSKVSTTKTKNLLLINFGGMQYPFGSNINLALTMTKIILEVVLSENIYNEIVICGGGEPIRQISESLNQINKKVRVRISPQKPIEFLKLLASCRTLVTVPGMSIVYEALYLSKPTIFILPLNYSQHLQVTIYKKMLKNAAYITWNDLEGYQTLPPGLPEEEGVKLAVELGNKFYLDLHAQARFKDLITEIFTSDTITKGITLSEEFNIGFDGAKQIAMEILNEISGDFYDF